MVRSGSGDVALNAGFGTGFDLDAFGHVAFWDVGEGWIGMRFGRCKIRWSRCPGLIL